MAHTTKNILSQTCSSNTREGAKICMTGFYKSCIGVEFRSLSEEFFSLCFRGFFSTSSVLAVEFGAGEDDRPFRL